MARNILIFADGTGNEGGLYQMKAALMFTSYTGLPAPGLIYD